VQVENDVDGYSYRTIRCFLGKQLKPRALEEKNKMIKSIADIYTTDEKILVLDTNIFRKLCHETPDWLQKFIEMSEQEYHFCLCDLALAEIINSMINNAITEAEYRKGISSLSKFISKKTPILPSGIDLSALAGISPETKINLNDVIKNLHYAWQVLLRSSSIEDFRKGIIVKENGKMKIVSFDDQTGIEILLARRADWVENFNQAKPIPPGELSSKKEKLLQTMLDGIDADESVEPAISVRLDLPVKHFLEKHLHHNKVKDAYNPDSHKKRNDGLDYGLYLYFLLPAMIVSDDGSFYKVLKDIDSYQKNWVWNPNDLGIAWEKGAPIECKWPSQ